MKKNVLFILLISFIISPINCFSQKSNTESNMEKMGLVDIKSLDSTIWVDLMYTRSDNFTGKILYTDLKKAYLHINAAKALVKAQKILKKKKPELSLIVYDAARPMHIQQKMWNVVAGTPLNIYVSNPKNGGGLHNYGMAVDVSLCNSQGDTINMGTIIDYLGPLAHIDKEQQMIKEKRLSEEAVKNRQLLREVMKEAGFKALRTEWWHFNFISRAEARSKYKVIK